MGPSKNPPHIESYNESVDLSPEPVRESVKRHPATHSRAGPSTYFRHNWREPASILTAGLLATTALTTPLLASALGAAALVGASCYMLVKSSDAVVHSAKALGTKAKISPLLLGLALGALTSMPEFAISMNAALQGMGAISVGNIVGTNIGNILLILGLTAAISPTPIVTSGTSWKFNTAAMMGVTALYGAGLAMGSFGLAAGLGLLGIGGAYMYATYIKEQDDEIIARINNRPVKTIAPPPEGMLGFSGKQAAAYAVAGVGGLIAASALMVTSATALAVATGISPVLVSATLVAVGTSLPELAIGIKAVRNGEMDMAVGNIVGSNIFNILVVGGAAAAAAAAWSGGLTVPPEFTPQSLYGAFNLAAFAGSAGLLTAALLKGKGTLTRAQGVAGMALYAAFTAASLMLSGPAEPAAEPVKVGTAYEQSIPAQEIATLANYHQPSGPS